MLHKLPVNNFEACSADMFLESNRYCVTYEDTVGVVAMVMGVEEAVAVILRESFSD